MSGNWSGVKVALISFLGFVSIFVTTGFTGMQSYDYYKLSHKPWNLLVGCYQESVFHSLFAYLVRLNGTIQEYTAFCKIQILFGILVFFYFVNKKYSKKTSVCLLIILLAHPVLYILAHWIGQPDSTVFLLQVVALFTQSTILLGVIGFIGGGTHFTIFFLGALFIIVLRKFAKCNSLSKRQVLVLFSSMISSKLLIKLYSILTNQTASESRIEYVFNNWEYWFEGSLDIHLTWLFSLHSGLWFLFIAAMIIIFTVNRRYFYAVIFVHIISLFVVFFSRDSTRIGSILLWPATIHPFLLIIERGYLSKIECYGVKKMRLLLTYFIILAIFTPKYYVWEREIFSPDRFLYVKNRFNIIKRQF